MISSAEGKQAPLWSTRANLLRAGRNSYGKIPRASARGIYFHKITCHRNGKRNAIR
jgi:hypothetical protein